MSLPKINYPIFDLLFPISKIKTKFRPFLVKEKKLLLTAIESSDKNFVESTTKQILNNCLLSEIDIDSLPLIDIEYGFYQLRARSEGEIVSQQYKCQHLMENGDVCNNVVIAEFNLLELEIQNNEVSDLIQLTDVVGLKLKFPEYGILNRLKNINNAADTIFELIADSIEYIFENDNIYYAKEVSKEELIEFLESLNSSQFEKIENYFNNLPSIKKVIDIRCSKCGTIHKIKLNDFHDFLE